MTPAELKQVGSAAVAWRMADLLAEELAGETSASRVLPAGWTETRESRAAYKAWKQVANDATHAWNAFTSILCDVVALHCAEAPEQVKMEL